MKKTIKKKNKISFNFPVVSLFFIFCFIVAFFFLFSSNLKIYQKRADIKDYVSEKQKEIQLIKHDEDELKESEYILIEKEFLIEKMAREQLLLKKPGEEVVFISFPETKEIEETEKQESVWWNPFTWKFER